MPFNARQTYTARHDFSTGSNIGSSSNVGGSSTSGSTVNGILRKANGSSSATSMSALVNTNEVRHVDLLMFGYACKVFRDDGKARDIDQGKHLIPWMGDNTLKIDRYDVRGALYDLTPYEPPPGGYGNRLDYLTAEEQRAEQLCEEERYLFLYNNEEDVITKQEEELKRLQQETNGSSYSQVGFAYDQSQQIGPNREELSNSPTCEEAEQAFQLPYNFQVPAGMQLPETMKQHAIIEKTARFIASQGVQMEILLKAKQSNNVQFEFLSQSSILNPYYKYVISSIKDGSYPQRTETKEKENKDTDNKDGSSIANAEQLVTKPVVTVPTIKYKPSADCAYTQLISKIKGVPLSELHDECSRQSSVSQQESANNSPSLTPVLLQYNGATFITEQDDNSNSNLAAIQSTSDSLNDSQPKVEILKNSSALALAQNYSSDSETEDEVAVEPPKQKTPPKLEFPLPPESLQNIIDKTAVYVIKNGRQFEETLRSKSVERFTFLLPDNEYYPYYMYKITDDPNAASKEQKKRKAKAVAEALLSKKGLSGDKTSSASNPVSFSIKTKDETTANVSLQQPALPQEHSDEEDKPKVNNSSNASAQRHVPEHVQKAIQLVESQLMARNAQLAATLALRKPTNTNSNVSSSNKPLSARYETDKVTAKLTNSTPAVLSGTSTTSKAEAERNALFEQQQQQRHKELKKAEEKVKDKLAQIAREKLGGLISKEKQLQLERKRKAMAFLNQIKGASKDDNNSKTETPPSKTVASNVEDGNNSDNSDVSVHSIPITSYGPNSEDELEENLQHQIVATTPPSPPHITAKVKDLIHYKNATVNVSDDDEVELISETRPREVYSKRRSRSKSREILKASAQMRRHYRKHDKRTPSTDSMLSSHIDYDEDDEQDTEEHRIRRSKSKSHKSKKSKTKKSSKSKKKSKKHSISKSRTPTRSRSRSHQRHRDMERYRQSSRSHSYTPDDYNKQDTSDRERKRDRKRSQRKRSSLTPSPSDYSSYSRSHKTKKQRYD